MAAATNKEGLRARCEEAGLTAYGTRQELEARLSGELKDNKNIPFTLKVLREACHKAGMKEYGGKAALLFRLDRAGIHLDPSKGDSDAVDDQPITESCSSGKPPVLAQAPRAGRASRKRIKKTTDASDQTDEACPSSESSLHGGTDAVSDSIQRALVETINFTAKQHEERSCALNIVGEGNYYWTVRVCAHCPNGA